MVKLFYVFYPCFFLSSDSYLAEQKKHENDAISTFTGSYVSIKNYQ